MECGLTRHGIYRRARSGLWQRMLPDVYRTGPGTSPWHQWVAALAKWGRGVASHRSAAALLGLDGFPPDMVEISTPQRRKPPPGDFHVHHVGALAPDCQLVAGIPTTSATRTLLDVAGVAEADAVELALEDALRRRLTSLPRLRWVIEREARHRRGVRGLRDLVASCDRAGRVTESGFETRLFQALRRGSLPLPVKQHEIRDGRGKLQGRADFAYPGSRLALEAVSYRWHSGRAAWAHDQTRANNIAAAGWRTLAIVWEQLRDRPDEVVEQVRHALRDDG